MTIAFIHPHKAFLPEIPAYQDFFHPYQIKTVLIKRESGKKIDADVEWHFMGLDCGKRKKGVIKIHEYASASTPPFPRVKNLSKRIISVQPDYRLFQNKYVKEKLGFSDLIPSGFRDMGVDDAFLSSSGIYQKEYDFIYTGSVNRTRKIDKLIECFTTGSMKSHSLMVLSTDYAVKKKKLRSFKNISFAGPVKHGEVMHYILKARFALNYLRRKEPFTRQTSTKFLEYAALKIPVVSTEYLWIRNFQRQYGGSYFYLDDALSNLRWEEISTFPYSFPGLQDWTWDKQIRSSGVLEFLQSRFPGLSF